LRGTTAVVNKQQTLKYKILVPEPEGTKTVKPWCRWVILKFINQ
jgi:hypothetical protein